MTWELHHILMAMAAMGNPQNGGPDGGKVRGHVYTMLPEWNMVPIAILQFFNSMFKKGLQFHACSLCVFAVLVCWCLWSHGH